MTREEAIKELKRCIEEQQGFMECRWASREANQVAIEALQQPTIDEIISRCAEVVAYTSICDNCEYYKEIEAVCVCDGKNCVETTENVLREKVLE